MIESKTADKTMPVFDENTSQLYYRRPNRKL